MDNKPLTPQQQLDAIKDSVKIKQETLDKYLGGIEVVIELLKEKPQGRKEIANELSDMYLNPYFIRFMFEAGIIQKIDSIYYVLTEVSSDPVRHKLAVALYFNYNKNYKKQYAKF